MLASINDLTGVKKDGEEISWDEFHFTGMILNDTVSKLAFEGLGCMGIPDEQHFT